MLVTEICGVRSLIIEDKYNYDCETDNSGPLVIKNERQTTDLLVHLTLPFMALTLQHLPSTPYDL